MRLRDHFFCTYYTAKDIFAFHHQISYFTTESQNHTVSHAHKCYEIMQLIAGKVTYIVDGSQYDMSEGDVIIITKNQFHSIEVHSEIYERRVVEFDPNFLLNNATPLYSVFLPFEENTESFDRLIKSSSLGDLSIGQIMSNIEKCVNDRIDIEHYLYAYTLELILEIKKFWNKSTQTTQPSYRSNTIVENAIAYIHDNILRSISLEELAAYLCTSKYHLCHLFKKHVGTSMLNYITFKKMMYAEMLILKGHMPSEVCEKLGYHNYSNFYIQYKKYLNKSPNQTKREQLS